MGSKNGTWLHIRATVRTKASLTGSEESVSCDVNSEHCVSADRAAKAPRQVIRGCRVYDGHAFDVTIKAEVYEVLQNLLVPTFPGKKTYEEVKTCLKEHYSPKTSIIAEGCKFD